MSFTLACTCGPNGATVIGRGEADAWRMVNNGDGTMSCGACRSPATRLSMLHIAVPRRVLDDAFSSPGEMMPASPLRSIFRPPPLPDVEEAAFLEERAPLGERYFGS